MTDLRNDAAVSAQQQKRKLITRILGVIAILFGVMTIKEGGTVLFSDGPAREAAGNVVPFVLMFNFASGFVYMLTGLGMLLGKGWARTTAMLLAITTGLVLISLGVHILLEQPFEVRTAIAMAIRTAFWVATALVLNRFAHKMGAAHVRTQ